MAYREALATHLPCSVRTNIQSHVGGDDVEIMASGWHSAPCIALRLKRSMQSM